jgi:hypothetical protein
MRLAAVWRKSCGLRSGKVSPALTLGFPAQSKRAQNGSNVARSVGDSETHEHRRPKSQPSCSWQFCLLIHLFSSLTRFLKNVHVTLTRLQLHGQDRSVNQPWLELTDPAAIELLLSENALAALAPFFDRARSLSEAATLIGWKLPRLTSWVNRLLEVKVLQVERVETRKGSSIKFYRTVAPVFYLPYGKLGAEYFDAFREEMRVNLEYRLEQGLKRSMGQERGGWGYQIKQNHLGGTSISEVCGVGAEHIVNDPNVPPATHLWTEVQLSGEEARAFNSRLNALLHEYQGRQAGKRYLVRLGFALLDD